MSVQRWLKRLRTKSRSPDFDNCATKKAALFWLKKYISFLKKTNQNQVESERFPTDPNSIMRHRELSIKSEREVIKRSHEEWVEDFSIHLQNVKTATMPNGYAPKSVATAIGLIRSFYKTNYYPLQEVALPPPTPIRDFKVPTVVEVRKICKYADPQIGTYIKCAKDSALRIGDLLGLTFDRRSSKYGTIEQQLRKDIVPVHIEYSKTHYSMKTGSSINTFFGPNAIEAIKENIPITRSGRIFKMCTTSVQQRVKSASIRAKVGTKNIPVTPHCLRKFFNTTLKYAGMNESMVERMMGHSLGGARDPYLATPISDLAELYMKYYPAIDIRENKNNSVNRPHLTDETLLMLKKYLPDEEYELLKKDL